jgi:hypothetical protein
VRRPPQEEDLVVGAVGAVAVVGSVEVGADSAGEAGAPEVRLAGEVGPEVGADSEAVGVVGVGVGEPAAGPAIVLR